MCVDCTETRGSEGSLRGGSWTACCTLASRSVSVDDTGPFCAPCFRCLIEFIACGRWDGIGLKFQGCVFTRDKIQSGQRFRFLGLENYKIGTRLLLCALDGVNVPSDVALFSCAARGIRAHRQDLKNTPSLLCFYWNLQYLVRYCGTSYTFKINDHMCCTL